MKANRKTAPKKTPKSMAPIDMAAMQMRRMAIIGGLLGAFMVAVVGMCAYLQGCQGELFTGEAEKNYLRTLRLDTQRGDIFDRNMEALASSVEVDTVYATPRKVADPIGTAEALSKLLDMPSEHLVKRLTSDKHFVFLKRQITDEESARVRAAKIQGIELMRESKRFYPKKDLAGQVLGLVGVDSHGHDGLEVTWDEQLRGGQLAALYHRDSGGRNAMLEGLPPVESRAGHSLLLTLDEKIQACAERELERAVLSSGGHHGVAVVIDVTSSDVLAIAHYPRFNPNRYREEIAADDKVVKNRALSDIYEPGSTFKVFTIAAAMEEGLIGLDDDFNVEKGRFRIGRRTIHDTHPKEHLTVRQIVQMSSNIGTAKIAMLAGKEKIHQYVHAFGFGEATGIGSVGDSAGRVQPLKKWADITLANVAFGQGIAVTALQLTNALAAIARGGLLMRPRLVQAELDSDGNTLKRFEPEVVRRVISISTARQIIEAMKGVVEADGTGSEAWMYDYDVAGKTGTAQKADGLGGYSEDRWVASFFGIVPADRPRLAILVLVDEPTGQYYGGVVAAPAFKSIAEYSLNYLGVPPTYGHRERIKRPVKHGAAPASAEGAYYDWPEGKTPGIDPMEPLSTKVPDFTDLDVREAVALAQRHRLWIDVDGFGAASGQSVPAGTPLDPWSRVTVFFRPGEVVPQERDEIPPQWGGGAGAERALPEPIGEPE